MCAKDPLGVLFFFRVKTHNGVGVTTPTEVSMREGWFHSWRGSTHIREESWRGATHIRERVGPSVHVPVFFV